MTKKSTEKPIKLTPEENFFLKELYNGRQKNIPIRDIVNRSGLGRKRAWVMLARLGELDFYDYGLSLDNGELTTSGKIVVKCIDSF